MIISFTIFYQDLRPHHILSHSVLAEFIKLLHALWTPSYLINAHLDQAFMIVNLSESNR